ncbi:MAG: AMP-binding protein [Desulfomonilaceae bacterium]|nr:AMP-binding protein [Desulfomonilaceae bacterium]
MLEGFVPWPDDFVKLYKRKGYWEDLALAEHFDRWVQQHADRPAIVHDGREITYRDMGRYSTNLAYQLLRLGLGTYDRVIFQLFNSPELVCLFYACQKVGAIPICSLPTHRLHEISHFAGTVGARAHAVPSGKVKDFDFELFADEVGRAFPHVEIVLTVGKPERENHHSINELMHTDVDPDKASAVLAKCRPDPMEPAVFQLSGGTTDVPKIVPRTHNDYYYNAKCEAIAQSFGPETRCIVPMPLTHNMPMVCGVLPTHIVGGLLVLPSGSSGVAVMEAIDRYKANTLLTVPVIMHRMLEVPEDKRRQYDLSSFRRLWWGGNPVEPKTQLQFREVFSCDTNQVFGMAEGMIAWTRVDDPLETKLHTQGRPVSEADEIIIADVNTGHPLPYGETGELWVRGPYTIRGYYKAPERNREAFTEDGYYRTGDLMKRDEAGNLVFMGRVKDCISRGVEKINAEEVEKHILRHPKVRAVAVVAMPDKIMGERACAFVVPANGATLTLDELSEFLLNECRIAKFKIPERIELTDDLPISKVGKYEKKTLRERIAQILKDEASL